MIVQYTNTNDQHWLHFGSNYAVQAIDFDRQRGVRYRIISEDAATPALFPVSDFTIVDHRIPASWCARAYPSGGFELSPAAWLEANFWVRYFDGDAEAKRIFDLYASK
jgi:hypothetical protein